MLTPEQAANWQTAYNIAYYVLLGALFVSFVATGLTFIANNRLSDNLTARLTETTAATGRATTEAGQANERAAKLEKLAADARLEQEHLRQDNLVLQGRVEAEINARTSLEKRVPVQILTDDLLAKWHSAAMHSIPFELTIVPINEPNAIEKAREYASAFEGTPVKVNIIQGDMYYPIPTGLSVYDVENGPLITLVRELQPGAPIAGTSLSENPGKPTLFVGANASKNEH